jgi:copper chaperone CopZ
MIFILNMPEGRVLRYKNSNLVMIKFTSMKKILLIGLMTFSLSSCTIFRDISFNADHSGRMETKIDMTAMMSMMNENGGGAGMGMGSMSDMAQVDKTKEQLEAIPGISNVKVSFDTTGIVYQSYDFSSVEVLVNAMGTGGNSNGMMGMGEVQGTGAKPKITYKGKKFTFEEIDKKTLESFQKEDKKKEMAQMDMLLASSQMNTTIHFPTGVKKVSYKNASVTNDNTVNYVMPIKDLVSKDYKPLVINLK